MKTRHFTLVLLLSVTVNSLIAQTFEEYKKQQQQQMQQFAQKQQEGIEKLRKEYADYVAKRDKEWQDYLTKEWERYEVFTGKKAPERPKPTTIPAYVPPVKVLAPDVDPVTPTVTKRDPEKPVTVPDKPVKDPVKPVTVPDKPVVVADKPVEEPTKPISQPTIIPQPAPRPAPVPPVPQVVEPIRKPAGEQANLRQSGIQFYGRQIQVDYDPALASLPFPQLNQAAIASFWEKASATNYTPVVEQLWMSKTEINANDYGYFVLVKKFSESLYPSSVNLSRLLTWFIMVRSGYGVRIAYQDAGLALLLPALQQVYQTTYLTLNGMNYYIFPKLQSGSYFTYDKDYAATGRIIDFNVMSPFNLSDKVATRVLKFNYGGKNYEIPVEYNTDMMEFYKDYPLVDLSVYFNAAVSVRAKESLAEAIQPIVNGMAETDAVNFILRLVQTSFDYKTDPEQFGREKFFFAEELFFYPYSDCEDRSVLFTYLVRETLGLKVVGLEYSDHVAAAVSFTNAVTGDYLLHQNERFTVTDPTYINAPAGMTMPQYLKENPQICEVTTRNAEQLNLDMMWEKAQSAGFYKGSFRKSGKVLPDGSALLTGFFSKPSKLGTSMLTGTPDANTCFVARLNSAGETIWARAIAASGNAVGMSVETAPAGNIVIAGVYTGTIRLGSRSISSARGKADLFVASFTPRGELIWLNRGALESLPDSVPTAFSVSFSAAGVKLATNHAEQQLDDRSQGLFVDSKGGVFYSGMTNNALALAGNEKQVAFASAASVNIPALLKSEGERFMVEKQAEKSIAGLMAAIKLVRFMGMSLTGKQIVESLDINNPSFKKACPNIYKNLGKINFVKNSKGVITVSTENGGDISFDKVKITNNSTISISELSNGDYQIDILSGIKVGKLVVWYGLNYIKMMAKKGDLLFDYASDHSQVTVNVKKDILY